MELKSQNNELKSLNSEIKSQKIVLNGQLWAQKVKL